MLLKIHQLQDNRIIQRIGICSFYLAFFMELFIVIIDKSDFTNPIEGRLFQITFALFVLKVLTTKFEWYEYCTIFAFCVLGLLVDQISGRNEILRIFMFVAACKDVNIKGIMKLSFWVTLSGVLILAFLSIMSIFGKLSVIKEYPGEIFANRYCFGLGNANSFHIMIFSLILLGIYVYYDRLKWWMLVILGIANAGIFILTDARTAMIMIFGVLISFGILLLFDRGILKKGRRVFSFLCLLASGLSVAISLWFAYIAEAVHDIYWEINGYTTEHWLYKIDLLLTGRIRILTEKDIWSDMKSWKLFSPPEYLEYYDLGFVRLFFWYGIIPASIILLIFGALLVYLYRSNMTRELVFLTLIAVFTVVEAHFVSVYIGRCYPLFLLGMVWTFSAREAQKQKEKHILTQI